MQVPTPWIGAYLLSVFLPKIYLFSWFAWLPLQLLMCRSLSQPLAFPPFCSVVTLQFQFLYLASPKLLNLSPCSSMLTLVKQVTSTQTHGPSASDSRRFYCCAEQDTGFTLSTGVWIWFLCEYPSTLSREEVAKALADLVVYVWSLSCWNDWDWDLLGRMEKIHRSPGRPLAMVKGFVSGELGILRAGERLRDYGLRKGSEPGLRAGPKAS